MKACFARTWRFLLLLVVALAANGCASLKHQADDPLATRFAKTTIRALAVLPSLGGSEWVACHRGGEEQWRANFAAFDAAIRNADRQWRNAATPVERERALCARRRFSRIRTDLGAEYVAWRRVESCRPTTLVAG